MRMANARQVAQMQQIVASGFYGDMANYITRTASTPNSFGELTYTETITAVSCSFTDKVSSESWQQFADVQTVDGEIRFSAVTPRKGDAITITSRFGDSTFTDRRYHIVGIKDRGALGFVCALKAVDL